MSPRGTSTGRRRPCEVRAGLAAPAAVEDRTPYHPHGDHPWRRGQARCADPEARGRVTPLLEEFVGLEASEAVSGRLRIVEALQYLGHQHEAAAEVERLRGELPENSYLRQAILDTLAELGF